MVLLIECGVGYTGGLFTVNLKQSQVTGKGEDNICCDKSTISVCTVTAMSVFFVFFFPACLQAT